MVVRRVCPHGHTVEVQVDANRAGVLTFLCSQVCSPQHPNLHGCYHDANPEGSLTICRRKRSGERTPAPLGVDVSDCPEEWCSNLMNIYVGLLSPTGQARPSGVHKLFPKSWNSTRMYRTVGAQAFSGIALGGCGHNYGRARHGRAQRFGPGRLTAALGLPACWAAVEILRGRRRASGPESGREFLQSK